MQAFERFESNVRSDLAALAQIVFGRRINDREIGYGRNRVLRTAGRRDRPLRYRKFRLAPELPLSVKVQIIVYRRAGFGLLQAQIAFQQVRIAADNPGHDLAVDQFYFSGLQVQAKVGYFIPLSVVRGCGSCQAEHGPVEADRRNLFARKISEQHIPVDPLGRQALKRVFSGRIAQIG